MRKFDTPMAIMSAMVVIVGLGLIASLWTLSGKEAEPAQINVRCIGDHLLFESERTGDIQVIPNKCKKQYTRAQAPVTK